MRDDALNRISRAITSIQGLFRSWKARHAVAFQGYDDHTLRDIGLSRMDVRWAA